MVQSLDRTLGRCEELLEAAIASLRATNGAVLTGEAPQGLSVIATRGYEAQSLLGLMEQAARRAFADRAPHSLSVASVHASTTTCLAVPALVEGDVTAVIVLLLDGCELSLEACAERLAPILPPLGLHADRLRMKSALDDRALEIAALRSQLDAYAVDLRSTYLAERAQAQRLAASLAELERTYKATLHTLAVAVEAKDDWTGGHLERLALYGMALTRLLAPEHAADPQYEYGFLLHDIGKLTVPDAVLMTPGPLTESERAHVRRHPDAGCSILEGIPFLSGAREIVHAHHEWWNGAGYPRGIAGETIPLGARILSLCDAYDAMTNDRPYRKSLRVDVALAEVRRGRGTQFSPAAVDAFLSIPLDELEAVRARHAPSRDSSSSPAAR